MKRSFIKSITIGIVIVLSFSIGVITNNIITKNKNKVELIQIYENKNIYTIEFNNNSIALADLINNKYIFYPVELGGWGQEFNNIDDFKKCITTYLENVNY